MRWIFVGMKSQIIFEFVGLNLNGIFTFSFLLTCTLFLLWFFTLSDIPTASLLISSYVKNGSKSFSWRRIIYIPFTKFWQCLPFIILQTWKNQQIIEGKKLGFSWAFWVSFASRKECNWKKKKLCFFFRNFFFQHLKMRLKKSTQNRKPRKLKKIPEKKVKGEWRESYGRHDWRVTGIGLRKWKRFKFFVNGWIDEDVTDYIMVGVLSLAGENRKRKRSGMIFHTHQTRLRHGIFPFYFNSAFEKKSGVMGRV